MKFESFSNDHLLALYRIAKAKRRGVRPFFNHPKSMIALRTELTRRGLK